MTDDMMLQEVFAEVQTEESANLDAEEKDEGCVEKQEGSDTSEGSVGQLMQERREVVLGVVAEECRKGFQKGMKGKQGFPHIDVFVAGRHNIKSDRHK